MDTTSHPTTTPQRPAGIPAGWERVRGSDGTILDWFSHKSGSQHLTAEAIISPAEDPTLAPRFHLSIKGNQQLMTAADLHQFAAQFFEFYWDVCTHLPGVEVPQRLATASVADAGMEV